MSDRFYFNWGFLGDGPKTVWPMNAMWAEGTSKDQYSSHQMSFNSYYDGVRVPWRIATDYLWGPNNTTPATELMNSLYNEYIIYALFENLKDGYTIFGDAWNWYIRDGFNTAVGGAGPSTTFYAMGACAGMQQMGEKGDVIWQKVLETTDYNKTDPHHYYGNTLRLLSMLMLTGRYENLYIAPSSGTIVKLRNLWKTTYIHREHRLFQTAECGAISQGWHSAQWILEKNSEGFFTFKNRWIASDGKTVYLHMADRLSKAQCDYKDYYGNVIGPDSKYAQWRLDQPLDTPNYVILRNRGTGQTLEIEHEINTGYDSKVVEGESISSENNGRFSLRWFIERVE